MASQSRGVVKRGYLFDKKGLLDRKRWYVLRQDVAHNSCLIEIFKDEKTAARQEPPKSFINVHYIVEVHRVVERRQSFEVLCPGLGYRFMAHSDVEADEWVHAIRGLILYRRDPAQGVATLPSSLHTQPVAITHSHSIPSQLPTSTHLSSSSLPDSASLHSPSYPLHPNLPTPPDLATSPATLSSCRAIHRQPSAELPPPSCSFPPPPSPPSSSSESSMASGSNASFEQQPLNAVSENDTDFKFRVQVKEVEGLAVSGAADLVMGNGRLALHAPDTGQQLVSWPIASLRRYGVNNVSLTIVTGRNCSTGEGRFQFYTQHSRRVYSHLHVMAISKAATKTHSLRRTGPEPGEPPARLSPPSPHYSHIEHALTLPTTVEDYSRLSLPRECGQIVGQSSLSGGALQSSGGDPSPQSSCGHSHSCTTSTLC